MIFVDTSALFAFVDDDDDAHDAAVQYVQELNAHGRHITSSYVLVELLSLAHRRLGVGAVRTLDALLEAIEVVWVDAALHRAAMMAVLVGGRSGPSLVDQVSFELMRQRAMTTAFAFDDDFLAAGLTTVPVAGSTPTPYP
ncbi:MAG: type II toxin-antitoxin system VapC family toxin [Acidimicrobiales bacterium]